MRFRVILAALVFMLVVAGALFAASRQVSASVAPLTQDGRNICTVTAIGDGRHWLTAAHCVSEEDGSLSKGLAILGDTDTDVAVRDVKDDVAILTTWTAQAPPVRLAKHGPQCSVDACDAVRVIGHPFGFGFQVAVDGKYAGEGLVDPEDGRPYALFDITGAPGNSGSAILNSRGEIISVLQVGWGRSWSPIVGGISFDDLAKYRSYFQP